MGCETGRSSLPSLTIARAEGAGKRRRAVIGGQIFFAVIASGLLTYCCPLVAKGAARRLGAFRRERSRAEPGAGGRRAAALAKIHGSWRPHEFQSSEFAEVDAPRQGRCRSILDRMRESGQTARSWSSIKVLPNRNVVPRQLPAMSVATSNGRAGARRRPLHGSCGGASPLSGAAPGT